MISKFRGIIFDFDGTIADTSEDILASLKKAFIASKLFSSGIESKLNISLIGPPIKEIISSLGIQFNENDINSIIQNYREIYDNDSYENTFLYNGIYDFLKVLQTNNKLIFIATNKPLKPTLRLLDKLHINSCFDDVFCIDSHNDIKTKHQMVDNIITNWNLNIKNTILIGDGPSDIIAAKSNNIQSVGILSGFSSRDEIIKHNPEFIIEKHHELIDIFIT